MLTGLGEYSMVRLLSLMGILGFSWILVFLGSYIIFKLIEPIPDIMPGLEGRIITSLLKVALSAAFSGLWIYIMVKLRDLYVGRRLR